MSDRWLTYHELAEALGCSSVAAKSRAKRARWRRQTGNDGLARVLLPEGTELRPVRPRTATGSVPGPTPRTAAESAPGSQPRTEAEWLARLERLQTELTELARKLGAAEADAASARSAMDELRQDRDVWRARAERLTTAEGRADAAEERAEGLQAILDVERRRSDELHQERDRLLGQLADEQREHDQALDRLEQAQAAHVDELLALREQMAVVVNDRDRAAEALAAHLTLPWWRRLFA